MHLIIIVQAKDAQGNAIAIEDFQCRFVDIAEYGKISEDDFDKMVQFKCSQIFGAGMKPGFSDCFPWFNSLRDIFMQSSAPVDFESFNHPVGAFLAVPTSVSDPLAAFGYLSDGLSRIAAIESGLVESNIPKCLVLISNSETEKRSAEYS